MKNNISEWRRKAGLSQTELADSVGTTLSMIGKIERGQRSLNSRWLSRIAEVLGCDPSDLISDRPTIPIVGFVGAGAYVYAYQDMANGAEDIERPPMVNGEAVAVEVRGDSMLPLAEEGWLIVYANEATIDEAAVLNKVCVVQLEDDTMLVKRVTQGTKPQHYHLISTNAPMMADVRIRWASVVKAIVPR